MKKWMNAIFFGNCFIGAIILEIYGIQIWEGNLFSAIGLGIVVLITGYLFMDAIRSNLIQRMEGIRFYTDRLLNEEAERHSEICNLQKATYTATKKNAAQHSEQFGEVLMRLDKLEKVNVIMLQNIIELQMKSLEGQKNALNLEINYSKENTKQIIATLREEILTAIEDNNKEKASAVDWSIEDESEPEAYNPINEVIESEKKVIPLYDDPYKNLTTDEIASLFSTYK